MAYLLIDLLECVENKSDIWLGSISKLIGWVRQAQFGQAGRILAAILMDFSTVAPRKEGFWLYSGDLTHWQHPIAAKCSYEDYSSGVEWGYDGRVGGIDVKYMTLSTLHFRKHVP